MKFLPNIHQSLIRGGLLPSPWRDRAILLDRDGTINIDTGYISEPNGVRLIDGSARALHRAARLGITLIGVSNQSGIGRGLFDEIDLLQVQTRLDYLLDHYSPDLALDRFYFCPHKPEDKCRCRKPKGGLFRRFRKEFPDKKPLAMIGDKISDIQFVEKYQVPGILVRTGKGAETEKDLAAGRLKKPANLVAITDNLEAAINTILSFSPEDWVRRWSLNGKGPAKGGRTSKKMAGQPG